MRSFGRTAGDVGDASDDLGDDLDDLGGEASDARKEFRKLEDAGFVAVSKRFEGRKPLTEATMTPLGRTAFVAYLDAMQGLVSKP